MFYKLIYILFFLSSLHVSHAQQLPIEYSKQLNNVKSDSARVSVFEKVIAYYREKNRDSAIHYINLAIAISEKNNQLLMPLWYKAMYSNQLLARQMFAAAFKLLNEIERKSQELNRQNSSWKVISNASFDQNKYLLLAATYYNYQILMSQTSNPELVRFYIQKTRENADLSSPSRFNSGSSSALAFLMLRIKKPDSAIHILNLIKEYDSVSVYFRDFDNMLKGIAYSDLHQYAESNTYLRLALKIADSKNIATRSAFRLSQNYAQLNQVDSAYFYARYLLDTLSSFGFSNFEVDLGVAYKNMYECFNLMHKKDSAFKYVQLALKVQDSLNSIRIINLAEFQQLLLSENRRIEALDDERNEKVSRWTNIGAISFALLIGLIAILLYRNVRQSRLANASLIEQKEKLQLTLDQLKSTQSQLVQSEKMASLGELTAGIAHEIQNPLNFVNNFAEVNTELIDELETEANKGNLEEVKLLAKDIKENESKINFHGKRADAIVKSMLQHSRKSSGQKELTDINALCDEYLRLSYHGLRAKDKSFNAEFDTQFDTTLAPINVVPQDIGRVILNLINNGFYAVNERQKKDKDSGYKPRVTLTTRQEGNQVVIEVADNGTGMPDQVKEKIFQPFFTTKPTGEGTGLGLSLSYDIVTKGHGGTMEVETIETAGTKFGIRLPLK
jgi:two-component system NtrC family sensor kinase